MSIVILVGGESSEGSYEHRYLVNAFIERFGSQVTRVITAGPVERPLSVRLKRAWIRGNYRERLARALYKGGYGPDGNAVGKALFDKDLPQIMPGGERKVAVVSHNDPECEAILKSEKPDVIVVYGTAILREHIFRHARKVTLNMHTGLSPLYRGDSTLFWPIYYDDKEHLGVTVHKLVAEVDGGDIVYTGKVTYSAGDSEADLFAKGVKVGTELYLQAVQDVLSDGAVYHRQDLSLGREFRWIHRTVAAERQVLNTLERWAQSSDNKGTTKDGM